MSTFSGDTSVAEVLAKGQGLGWVLDWSSPTMRSLASEHHIGLDRGVLSLTIRICSHLSSSLNKSNERSGT